MAFAAVTASSSLQYLDLGYGWYPSQGAWRSIFWQQLTALTHLSLPVWPKLAASDVKRLALTCPELRYLDVQGALKTGVSLLALTKLTALTCTALDISGVRTESAVRALARLTSLKELRVWQPSYISRLSRLQLTALKQLRELRLPACRPVPPPPGCTCLSCGAPPRAEDDMFESKVRMGGVVLSPHCWG